MTHSFNDHSGAGHYIQTGKRWHIPIGAGFAATPEDWPSMGSVVEYLSQHAPGGMEREMPAAAVVPNWLGRLQEGGQYRRPGQYAGWLGNGFDPMTTAIDKRDLTDNPYWRDCTDEELTFRDRRAVAARAGGSASANGRACSSNSSGCARVSTPARRTRSTSIASAPWRSSPPTAPGRP